MKKTKTNKNKNKQTNKQKKKHKQRLGGSTAREKRNSCLLPIDWFSWRPVTSRVPWGQ